MSTKVTHDTSVQEAIATAVKLSSGLAQVIRGKDRQLQQVVAAFLAGGHVLLEDLPGLGKTTLAKTLAGLIGGDIHFRRIQCTPDLLPYDITGVDVFNPETHAFSFQPGPVFTNILLTDEINRTTPKVQSALLEVMAENQVTVGMATHRVDELFFVIATQNPIDLHGTYQLPAAQRDRFMVQLQLGFPDAETEFAILKEDPGHTVEVQPVVDRGEVLHARQGVRDVFVSDELIRMTSRLLQHTRHHAAFEFGASPRAGLMLLSMARGLAAVAGRGFVIDQDIVEAAPLVLAHRLIVRKGTARELLDEMVRREADQLAP